MKTSPRATENVTAFRNLAQAHAYDFMSRHTRDVFAFVHDFTGLGLHQTRNSTQSSRFTCTVRTNQRYDFALRYLEADAFNSVDSAVIDINIFNL